jgi:hypothetical protein
MICKRYANKLELQALMSCMVSKTAENKGITKTVLFFETITH